jgi:hypothetical protein
MESEIKQALDSELDKQRVVSMGKLEGVLGNVLDKIFQDDRREERRKDKLRRDMIKSAMARDESDFVPETYPTSADMPPASPMNQSQVVPPMEEIKAPIEAKNNMEPVDKVIPKVEDQLTATPESEVAAVPMLVPMSVTELESTPQEAPAKEVLPLSPATEVSVSLTPMNESANPDVKIEPSPLPDPISPKQKPKKHRVSGIQVTFVAIPANEEGIVPRSHIVGEIIHINTLHPDFTARIRSRLGRPVITERLGAYLGAILAGQYHAQRYTRQNLDPTIPAAFEDLISTMNKIEYNIRRKLPALQRSMGSLLPQSVVDTLQVEGDDFDDLDSYSEEEL